MKKLFAVWFISVSVSISFSLLAFAGDKKQQQSMAPAAAASDVAPQLSHEEQLEQEVRQLRRVVAHLEGQLRAAPFACEESKAVDSLNDFGSQINSKYQSKTFKFDASQGWQPKEQPKPAEQQKKLEDKK